MKNALKDESLNFEVDCSFDWMRIIVWRWKLKELQSNFKLLRRNYDYCQFKFSRRFFASIWNRKFPNIQPWKRKALENQMSLDSATHLFFSFLNSCPQSKHFSAASAGFPKVFQMWVRFGILPETKSKLALELAVIHFQYTFEPPMFLWNGTREPFQKNIIW